MKTLPEDFEPSALVGALADCWGFEAASADFVPVGAGSYHWVVRDPTGSRRFVTVDDLDRKPWLGDTRESVFDGLRRALDTAVTLRNQGLTFVVAPIRSNDGETLCRITPRYSIAMFPFVEGRAGVHGYYETAGERAGALSMLVQLHGATSAVRSVAPRVDLDVPGRPQLESALRSVDTTWSGGPFSERARRALAAYRSDVVAHLARAERLSVEVAGRSSGWVITHGEPHARNVMRAGEDQVLIDWDTVALAPPERDLWMFMSDTADEATIYADATGHALDEVAASFFRLVWHLADLSAYTNVVRSPHRRSEDTLRAYEAVRKLLATPEPWAADPWAVPLE